MTRGSDLFSVCYETTFGHTVMDGGSTSLRSALIHARALTHQGFRVTAIRTGRVVLLGCFLQRRGLLSADVDQFLALLSNLKPLEDALRQDEPRPSPQPSLPLPAPVRLVSTEGADQEAPLAREDGGTLVWLQGEPHPQQFDWPQIAG